MNRIAIAVVAVATASLVILGLSTVPPARAEDSPTDTLKQNLVDTAWEGFRLQQASFESGTGTVDGVVRWSLHLHQARKLDGIRSGSELRKEHLDRMVKLEATARSRHQAGSLAKLDLLNAKFHRIEAELWVSGVGKP